MIKTLVVVTGPTAVGKTDLCISLAQHFDIPIINADSRQIYKELLIGTAQPTLAQRQLVPHYFVGTLQLQDYYNAAMYEQEVLSLLEEQLFQKRDIALLSGGSMMYIDAVCNGIDDIPTIKEDIRIMVKQRYEKQGLEALRKELRRLDPEHYQIVDLNNPRRVIHALEICLQTGQTYTSFRKQVKKQRPFRIIKIGLNRERKELYNRINLRVDKMMESGLLDEARSLYDQRHTNALNTVGYKELFAYMDGKWDLNEAVERIKGNTRRYARKQLTWFKRDASMQWFHPDIQQQEIINYILHYE